LASRPTIVLRNILPGETRRNQVNIEASRPWRWPPGPGGEPVPAEGWQLVVEPWPPWPVSGLHLAPIMSFTSLPGRLP